MFRGQGGRRGPGEGGGGEAGSVAEESLCDGLVSSLDGHEESSLAAPRLLHVGIQAKCKQSLDQSLVSC